MSTPALALYQTPGNLPIVEYTRLADREISDSLAPARRVFEKWMRRPWLDGRVIPIAELKAWLELLGLPQGPVRAPLVPLSEERRRDLARDLERWGFAEALARHHAPLAAAAPYLPGRPDGLRGLPIGHSPYVARMNATVRLLIADDDPVMRMLLGAIARGDPVLGTGRGGGGRRRGDRAGGRAPAGCRVARRRDAGRRRAARGARDPGALPGARVLALSAHSDDAAREDMAAAGATATWSRGPRRRTWLECCAETLERPRAAPSTRSTS